MERTVAPARTNSAPFATAADASERSSSRISETFDSWAFRVIVLGDGWTSPVLR